MTILQKLANTNKVINSRKHVLIGVQTKAKNDLEDCMKLLLKGYSLDDDMKPLMVKYNHIDKIPDAKVHAGKEITANRMQDLMELVYPKVPHKHLVMVLVQKFGDNLVNYISNGERDSVIAALRSLATNLEDGKDVEMVNSN